MTAFSESFRSEVARIARKESKGGMTSLRKTATNQRSEIATLKRDVKELAGQLGSLAQALGKSLATAARPPTPPTAAALAGGWGGAGGGASAGWLVASMSIADSSESPATGPGSIRLLPLVRSISRSDGVAVMPDAVASAA